MFLVKVFHFYYRCFALDFLQSEGVTIFVFDPPRSVGSFHRNEKNNPIKSMGLSFFFSAAVVVVVVVDYDG
jgi:hypothetical protein